MNSCAIQQQLDPDARAFYLQALATAHRSNVPFLVGGAYGMARYTEIERHTKDLDFFVLPNDFARFLDAFTAAGYATQVTFQHWLGKAYCRDHFVDVIFSSGNGIVTVDEAWFEHAVDETVLGIPVRICPAEETIWSKSFIMERERFDGADIIHLIRARAEHLDWDRLLARFGPHWRVLLSHLILFGYVYPGERRLIPAAVMDGLLDRLRHEMTSPPPLEKVCQGTFLSRAQYLVDIGEWGYRDPRLAPKGTMSGREIGDWTAAIPGPTKPQ